MSTTFKTGWLLNDNGEKFAPKTLLSQVSTNDGVLLERKIETGLLDVKTELNTEIAVERARIDAFTALPEGSTTGDAALEDIKIKVDGTPADTAGNAVREQINTLDDKIDEEVAKLSSEIDYCLTESESVVFEIGAIAANSGNNVDSRTDRIRTGFIALVDKQIIKFVSLYPWNVFRYDENEVYIDNTDGAWKSGDTINLLDYATDGCKYVRIVMATDTVVMDSIITRFYSVSNLAKKVLYPDEFLKGKKVSFYGDSISTFAGWIPSGNRVYYSGSNAGVSDVSQTWWKRLVDYYDMDLVVNNSWSGRCVTSKRDTEEGNLNSGGYALNNISQLRTAEKEPEIIIIKLGVNDFLRLSDALPFGDYDGRSEITEDSVSFKGAYSLMMKRICETFPNAKVFCCTVNQFARSESGAFPQIRNNVNLVDFNNAIIEIASLFGAEVIRHDLCGITYFNSSLYMGDWSGTTGLHPNASGHELIGNLTIDFFKDREI